MQAPPLSPVNVKITFKGGPLDGSYEFPNYSPIGPDSDDPDRVLAWSLYGLLGSAVGKAAMGLSPAKLGILRTQGHDAFVSSGGSGHKYQTVQRVVDGDSVWVIAAHVPKNAKS